MSTTFHGLTLRARKRAERSGQTQLVKALGAGVTGIAAGIGLAFWHLAPLPSAAEYAVLEQLRLAEIRLAEDAIDREALAGACLSGTLKATPTGRHALCVRRHWLAAPGII